MSSKQAICPQCGGPVSPTAKFCRECGKAMVQVEPSSPPLRKCPHCAAPISSTARFCPVCGKGVGSPVQGFASQQAQSLTAPPARAKVALATSPRKQFLRSPLVWAITGAAAVFVLVIMIVIVSGVLSPAAPMPAFTLEPAQSYAVSSAQETRITDSATGQTIRFPGGGTGNVKIAKITSGPPAPFKGEGIHVEYQGTERIQLLLEPPRPGMKNIVMGYGYLPGAYVPNQWFALSPGEIVDGKQTVDLVMPFTPPVAQFPILLASLDPRFGIYGNLLALAPPAPPKAGANNYQIAEVEAKEDVTEGQVADVQQQIKTNVDQMLKTLPSNVPNNVRANAERKVFWDPYVYETTLGIADKSKTGDPYYTGFRIGDPWMTVHINYNTQNFKQSLAHETGHLITHILVGDDIYKKLEAQSPIIFGTDHGMGSQLNGRDSFYLEEPAYFAEYFLTGAVGGLNPSNIRASGMTSANTTPAIYDFPSVEGFGLLMLQSLTEKNDKVIAPVFKVSTPFPVVGASYGEVFEIIGRGATGNTQLLEHIRAFLNQKEGNADKLPIIAERNGWRYTVSGRVLDLYGDPAGYLKVESIARVGCQDYQAARVLAGIQDEPTDPEGKFNLVDVFPGDSLLRLTGNPNPDGSQAKWDIPIHIDWAKGTDHTINLGDIKMARLQLFVDGNLVADPSVPLQLALGKHTFKAVANGISPTTKRISWFWFGPGAERMQFQKDSGVQAVESSSAEFTVTDSLLNYVDVSLHDLTCDKRTVDSGHFVWNLKGAAQPTQVQAPLEASPIPTEMEAASNVQATPTISAAEQEFFSVWSKGVVDSGGASVPTTFSTTQAWQVTQIVTYHYNGGEGAAPGTIGLKANDGTIYGPWNAVGMSGSAGPDSAWSVAPNVVIPAGSYTVLDSDPATWSQNSETNGAGMAYGIGVPVSNPSTSPGTFTPGAPASVPNGLYSFRWDYPAECERIDIVDVPVEIRGNAVTIDFDAFDPAGEKHFVMKGSGSVEGNGMLSFTFQTEYTYTPGRIGSPDRVTKIDGSYVGPFSLYTTGIGKTDGTISATWDNGSCTGRISGGYFDDWHDVYSR